MEDGRRIDRFAKVYAPKAAEPGLFRHGKPTYNSPIDCTSQGMEPAMRRIAIINQKGGVGKTTTAVNLSAALARLGQNVCILDLDPQAHATAHFGIEPDGDRPSMYDVLMRRGR